MKNLQGFRELQIEDTRHVADGVQCATLMNVTGASGSPYSSGESSSSGSQWSGIPNSAANNHPSSGNVIHSNITTGMNGSVWHLAECSNGIRYVRVYNNGQLIARDVEMATNYFANRR